MTYPASPVFKVDNNLSACPRNALSLEKGSSICQNVALSERESVIGPETIYRGISHGISQTISLEKKSDKCELRQSFKVPFVLLLSLFDPIKSIQTRKTARISYLNEMKLHLFEIKT